MSRSSKVLLFGLAAVGLLLACLALAPNPGHPSAVDPLRPNPASVARRNEVPIRSAIGAEPAREPGREAPGGGDSGGLGRDSSASLDVRVSSPLAGECELVLRCGSIEWGRGVTHGGRLRFDGLVRGEYLLRAEGTGYLLADFPPDEEWSGREHAWRRIAVPGRGATVEVELRLVRAATLIGVVRDPSGAPVPDAVVLVQDVRRPARALRIPVDEGGTFCVEALAPSWYGIAVPSPHSTDGKGLVALPLEQRLVAGEVAWLELRLEEGQRTIRGRVVDRREVAVDGLRMVCTVASSRFASKGSSRPPVSRIVARTRTDPDGGFRFAGLPAAELRVAVDARESELLADGRRRRLGRGFAPLDVDTLWDDVDLGALSVELPPSLPEPSPDNP